MKPIRGPRATWTTCGHILTAHLALGIAIACIGLVIAAIWTAPSLSWRLALTAAVLGAPAVVTAVIASHLHDTAPCYRDTLTIPLPWREAIEDDQEATR